jgi:hypothetical protein
MKMIHTAMRGGKAVRTRGHRWPEGFPSGFYVGRQQGFRTPSGPERQAATMKYALRSFKFLGLREPIFGKT